jgi:hypothetical protein
MAILAARRPLVNYESGFLVKIFEVFDLAIFRIISAINKYGIGTFCRPIIKLIPA